MAPARSAGNGYDARRCQRHKQARDSHLPDATASRRHKKNYSINNPSLACEALRKPPTKGTSERSERES
jgi:hypothetical protein